MLLEVSLNLSLGNTGVMLGRNHDGVQLDRLAIVVSNGDLRFPIRAQIVNQPRFAGYRKLLRQPVGEP